MNIYYTDGSPVTCANNLDDYRLVMAIPQVTQLLMLVHISADRKLVSKGGKLLPIGGAYTAHLQWARKSKSNYTWLKHHYTALTVEYEFRFGREHRYKKFLENFREPPHIAEEGKFEAPPNCARDEKGTVNYTHEDRTLVAYRMLLKHCWSAALSRKKSTLGWTKTLPPAWWPDWTKYAEARRNANALARRSAREIVG